MVAHRNACRFRAAGRKRFELMDQPGAQSDVMRERGKGERAVPGGHFTVMDRCPDW